MVMPVSPAPAGRQVDERRRATGGRCRRPRCAPLGTRVQAVLKSASSARLGASPASTSMPVLTVVDRGRQEDPVPATARRRAVQSIAQDGRCAP